MVGSPTLIYRNPVGLSGVTGTLTVDFLNHNTTLVTSGPKMLEATDQDDPLDQKVLALDGMDHGELTVLDVRITLAYDGPFATALPPSIDAFMIPVTEKETQTQ
jgi:hypothetical protein